LRSDSGFFGEDFETKVGRAIDDSNVTFSIKAIFKAAFVEPLLLILNAHHDGEESAIEARSHISKSVFGLVST